MNSGSKPKKYSGTYICPTGSSSLKWEERRRKENRVNQETMKMQEQWHLLTTQPRALMLTLCWEALCPVDSQEIQVQLKPQDLALWASSHDRLSQTLTSLTLRIAASTWKASGTSWGFCSFQTEHMCRRVTDGSLESHLFITLGNFIVIRYPGDLARFPLPPPVSTVLFGCF